MYESKKKYATKDWKISLNVGLPSFHNAVNETRRTFDTHRKI